VTCGALRAFLEIPRHFRAGFWNPAGQRLRSGQAFAVAVGKLSRLEFDDFHLSFED